MAMAYIGELAPWLWQSPHQHVLAQAKIMQLQRQQGVRVDLTWTSDMEHQRAACMEEQVNRTHIGSSKPHEELGRLGCLPACMTCLCKICPWAWQSPRQMVLWNFQCEILQLQQELWPSMHIMWRLESVCQKPASLEQRAQRKVTSLYKSKAPNLAHNLEVRHAQSDALRSHLSNYMYKHQQ